MTIELPDFPTIRRRIERELARGLANLNTNREHVIAMASDELEELYLWVRAAYPAIYRQELARGKRRPAVSAFSVLMGEIESRAIVAMNGELEEITGGPFPHVFLYDGMMVPVELNVHAHIPALEAAIFRATHLRLSLVIKPIPHEPVRYQVDVRGRYVGNITQDVRDQSTVILRAPMGASTLSRTVSGWVQVRARRTASWS